MKKAYTELSAKRCVLDFDERVPIGTVVEYCGKKYKTWSHAGRLPNNNVGVFLEGVDVAVPVSELKPV